MRVNRHFRRSLAVAVPLLLAVSPAGAADDQEPSVQKLLERGALAEAVQRAESDAGNPESTYLAAQAAAKMNEPAKANEQFARLRESGDGAWKAIGESGAELIAGNLSAAMDAANRAIGANADNPYAHYQAGIVASRQNDHARAAEAFGRTVELKPDFAYAHYYAGLATQRLKQIPKMSQYFEAFMRLAPEAPERAAVAAILRTLRG